MLDTKHTKCKYFYPYLPDFTFNEFFGSTFLGKPCSHFSYNNLFVFFTESLLSRHGVIDKPGRAEEQEQLKSRIELDNEIEEIKRRQQQQVVTMVVMVVVVMIGGGVCVDGDDNVDILIEIN